MRRGEYLRGRKVTFIAGTLAPPRQKPRRSEFDKTREAQQCKKLDEAVDSNLDQGLSPQILPYIIWYKSP